LSRATLTAAALLVPCLTLAACSGLFRSNAKPEQIYYLRGPSAGAATASAGSDSTAGAPATASPAPAMPVSLRVGRVEAGPGLDSPHIMLLQADHRMNFYSGSRWPAPVPFVVEALAVRTLRVSGEWASVEEAGSPFPSDYLLQLHVRRFEADYTESAGAPVVHVDIDCTLGRHQGREVLATFSVSGTAAATANRQGEVVAAFEQATGTALNALAQRAAQAARLDLQHAAQPEPPPAHAGTP